MTTEPDPQNNSDDAPAKTRLPGRGLIAGLGTVISIVFCECLAHIGVMQPAMAILIGFITVPVVILIALYLFYPRTPAATGANILRNRKPAMTAPALALHFGGFIFIALGAAMVQPFSFFKNAGELMLIGAPLAAAALYVVCQKNKYWPFKMPSLQPGGAKALPKSLWFSRIIGGGIMAGIFAISCLYLNQSLDQSPAAPLVYGVTDKHITYSRRGHNPTYHLTVVRSAAANDPTASADLKVRLNDYQVAVPRKTEVTLQTHPGVLQMPWYENHYAFSTPEK